MNGSTAKSANYSIQTACPARRAVMDSSDRDVQQSKKAPATFAPSGCNTKMFRTRKPDSHDVLCGRGGFINSHPGNAAFRDWVYERREKYISAKMKKEKKRLAKEIIRIVRSQDPPGKFLTQDTGGWWVEVDEAKAMQKTGQALREGAPQVRAANRVNGCRLARIGLTDKVGDEGSAKTAKATPQQEATTETMPVDIGLDRLKATAERLKHALEPDEQENTLLVRPSKKSRTTPSSVLPKKRIPPFAFKPLDASVANRASETAAGSIDVPNIPSPTLQSLTIAAELARREAGESFKIPAMDSKVAAMGPSQSLAQLPVAMKATTTPKRVEVRIFALKMYHMADNCDPSIATWSNDGTMFVVKDPAKFQAEVIPKYFAHKDLKYFVKQLKSYGFRKVRTSANVWVLYHDKFQRGRPGLLVEMSKACDQPGAHGKEDLEALRNEINELEMRISRIEKVLVLEDELASLGMVDQKLRAEQYGLDYGRLGTSMVGDQRPRW